MGQGQQDNERLHAPLAGWNGELPVIICQWYAMCDNTHDGFVWHPVLAFVPTCNRCANKHDMVIVSEDAIMSGLSHIAAWPDKYSPDVWANATDLLGGVTGEILPATAKEILKLAI